MTRKELDNMLDRILAEINKKTTEGKIFDCTLKKVKYEYSINFKHGNHEIKVTWNELTWEGGVDCKDTITGTTYRIKLYGYDFVKAIKLNHNMVVCL